MKILALILTLVVVLGSAVYAAKVPVETKPDFARSRVVIQSIDSILKNLQIAVDEGDLSAGEVKSTQSTCRNLRREVQYSVLKREYTQSLGETKWMGCHKLYREFK
jgi:opacity protein-like surface antigen